MMNRVYAMMFGAQQVPQRQPVTGKVRIKLALSEDMADIADSMRSLDNKAAEIATRVEEIIRMIEEVRDARNVVTEARKLTNEATALQSAAAPILSRYSEMSKELGLEPFDDENYAYLVELQNGDTGMSIEELFYSTDTLSELLEEI